MRHSERLSEATVVAREPDRHEPVTTPYITLHAFSSQLFNPKIGETTPDEKTEDVNTHASCPMSLLSCVHVV